MAFSSSLTSSFKTALPLSKSTDELSFSAPEFGSISMLDPSLSFRAEITFTLMPVRFLTLSRVTFRSLKSSSYLASFLLTCSSKKAILAKFFSPLAFASLSALSFDEISSFSTIIFWFRSKMLAFSSFMLAFASLFSSMSWASFSFRASIWMTKISFDFFKFMFSSLIFESSLFRASFSSSRVKFLPWASFKFAKAVMMACSLFSRVF